MANANSDLAISGRAYFAGVDGNAAPYLHSSVNTVLGRQPFNFYMSSSSTDLSAGTNPFSGFLAGLGSGPMLRGLNATAGVGASPGLGSGSLACASSPCDPIDNLIVLSPAGSPASVGQVTMTFPIAAQHEWLCTPALVNNSAGWPGNTPGVTLAYLSSSETQITWNTGGTALTAGNTYSLQNRCEPY